MEKGFLFSSFVANLFTAVDPAAAKAADEWLQNDSIDEIITQHGIYHPLLRASWTPTMAACMCPGSVQAGPGHH